MTSDYFALDNFYAQVTPPTKVQEILNKELSDRNAEAKAHNNSINNSKPITGPLKRFCGLCEAPLKEIKSKPLEGLPEISIPRYRCPVDKSVWQGIGLNVYHESKKSVKAICFEMDGTV